jgi:hypothetical protein
MPCIINPDAKTSKEPGNLWEALCGKTLYMSNKPHKSLDSALRYGGAICKKCRKIAEGRATPETSQAEQNQKKRDQARAEVAMMASAWLEDLATGESSSDLLLGKNGEPDEYKVAEAKKLAQQLAAYAKKTSK